jgi:hypothetical protein
MSTHIEWVKATEPALIEGEEQLADGNIPNENGHTDYIGIAWGDAVLYGSPVEVLKALADAALLVAQHMDDQE